MVYYNKLDKKQVDEMCLQLKADGFEPDVTTWEAVILRKDNPYRKCMKWNLQLTADSGNGATASYWFKSKPEAMRDLNRDVQPLPVGNNRMLLSYYKIVQPA